MKWQRYLPVGCAGMFLVYLTLPFVPYFLRIGQASLARQHWLPFGKNGADDYTLIVSHNCFCENAGQHKLTVQNGAVTAVEIVGGTLGPASLSLIPADYAFLTVDAMLSQAENVARISWGVPWFSALSIDYDPTYGYVTRYNSDANGWLALFLGYVTDSGYTYTARELQFIEP
jgi:uncharacterized protein DUF6174